MFRQLVVRAPQLVVRVLKLSRDFFRLALEFLFVVREAIELPLGYILVHDDVAQEARHDSLASLRSLVCIYGSDERAHRN